MRRDRGFLHATHGLAGFQWEADGEYNVFEIRDHAQSVRLDCSIRSPGDWFTALTKIVRLRRALQDFERAVLETYRERAAETDGERVSTAGGGR